MGGNLSPSYWYFENMYHCSDPSVLPSFGRVLQYKLRTSNTSPWITSSNGCSLLLSSSWNYLTATSSESINVFQQVYFENPLNLPVWSHPVKAWNPGSALTFSLSNTSYNIPISTQSFLPLTNGLYNGKWVVILIQQNKLKGSY